MRGLDVSQVNRFVADATAAVPKMVPEVKRSLFKAGLNMKERAREIILGARAPFTSIPAYPFSIDFDQLDDGLTIELGPDPSKNQGRLDNILEYGGIGVAPIPHVQPALEEEIPRTERALADIASRTW